MAAFGDGGRAAAGDGDVAIIPEGPGSISIGQVLYPNDSRFQPRRRPIAGGGRLPVADDETAVTQAIAPGEETWTALSQHLSQIPAERVTQVKGEVLARLAKQEPRISPTEPTRVAKFIRNLGLTAADVNFKGEHGITALMQAAANDRSAHVQDLLTAGADPNVQNDMGETALMWAAAYGAMSPIRDIREQPRVAAPIPVNFDLTDNLGWNALMVAAWCGNYQAVRQLANRTTRGARDINGRTAVEIANDPASPATLRVTPQDNVLEKVLIYLGAARHTGGRKRTYRSKTKDKKRGTR